MSRLPIKLPETAERATPGEHEYSRRAALQALADQWPDEITRKLLAERSRVDGIAAMQLAKQHSEFGRIVFTKGLNGWSPYLDPAKPIPREHIEQAAGRAHVPADEINKTVRSLSAHMGWDITRGTSHGRQPRRPQP